MDVSSTLWWVTGLLTVGFLLVDVLIIGRRPHEPSMRECAVYLTAYIGAAIIFGFGVWYFAGAQYGGEFFAGWLTEYSLSIDNLFIFIIIMGKFAVPRQYQQTALLVGIVLALSSAESSSQSVPPRSSSSPGCSTFSGCFSSTRRSTWPWRPTRRTRSTTSRAW